MGSFHPALIECDVKGDPIDPISFEQAIRAVWYRLGSNAGLDVRGLQLAEDPSPASPEARASRKELEEQAENHFSEAHLRVWGLMTVGELRYWTFRGANWERPTPEEFQSRICGAADEPSGLYVDGQELTAKLASRWPDELASLHATERPSPTPTKPTADLAKPKVGRKKGPGYKRKDVPTFELILEAQRQSDNVEDQYPLVKRFAGDPDATYYWRNVDGLRKGLPKWLAENGHEWFPSK